MKKKVIIGVIVGIATFVLIVTAVVIGNVIALKVTCTHDNIFEIEYLPSKPATCQETGLTMGKKCNICGKKFVKQEKTNKTACKESDWIVDKEPSNTEDGTRHTECTMCGKVIRQEIIGAGTQGLEYRENSDGTYELNGDGNKSSTEIIIPSTYNGQKVTSIGTHAFMNNSAKSITIPNTIKTIQAYAFSRCSKLETIVIPQGVESISYYCFMSCDSLKTVDIPDSVTFIDYSAFWGCTSLKNINLPKSGTKIGAYAFKGCTSLISVDIPDGMTVIGNATFFGCTSLKSVTIPSTVTKIMAEAFASCTSLSTIRFEGTIAQWNSVSLATSWRLKVPATEVICSDGVVTLN